MLRKLALLAALSFAAWLPAAAAVGLGEIEVGSALNQRLVASIPLLGAEPEELETLQVRLASNADFERAGIERSEYLSTLQFTIRKEGGAPRIEVRSPQIVREPFVNFLLEVRSGSSRFLREFTVLLDPPSFASTPEQPSRTTGAESRISEASPPAVAPVPAPVVSSDRPRSARPIIAPATPTPRTPSAAASANTSETYGPVRPQETFWSIAAQLRPDASLTMDQVLLALYEANPQAFDGGMNRLLAGSMLRVPPAEAMHAVSPAEAKRRVTALRAGRSASAATRSRAPAEAPAPTPTPRPSLTPEPSPTPSSAEQARSPGAPASSAAAPLAAPAPSEAPTEAPASESGRASLPAPADEAPAAVVASPSPAESALADPSIAAGTDATAGADPAANADLAGNADPKVATPESPIAEPPAASADPVPPPAPAPDTPAEAGPMELLVPLIGALLVLGGLGYFLSNWLRKRREARRTSAGAGNAPPVTPSMASPLLGAAAATIAAKTAGERPGATTQSELETLSASLNEDAESFETQQLQTQQLQARSDLLPEGLNGDPFDMEANEAEAARQALEEGAVDFDLGGQMANETMHINLDEGDPLAEADFHLAYGLYDEAILHLKQAAEKDPGRVELRVKLAETYFAAGKADEFESLARSLCSEVDAASWQKVALMGHQLCPYSDLFQGSDINDPGAVDLSLTTTGLAAPESMSEGVPSQAASDDLLDFKLEDLDLPAEEAPSASAGEAKRDNTLEFDLGDFDLGTPDPEPVPAAPAAADNAIDFELENFDLGASEEPSPARANEEVKFEPMDLKLEDFDIGDLSESSGMGSGDDVATKLDLARAYVEMGDTDGARGVLNEVIAQGSATQQDEAKQLLARLA